jgi:hypothetical protein
MWMQHSLTKQRFNDYKKLVSYARLFLPDGFDILLEDTSYEQTVLSYGKEVESNMQVYLTRRQQSPTGYGSYVKILEELRKAGELHRYIALLHQQKINDCTSKQYRYELTFISASMCTEVQ